MKNKCSNNLLLLLLITFIITGCTKNETRYYADAEDEGIAIFSNNGNNLLTCFIDNKPWRTVDRTVTIIFSSGTNYEVDIRKQVTNSIKDTLIIRWLGYYAANDSSQGTLNLILPVAKNFSYKDFAALQGQRLHIDTTNGYFTTSISNLNLSNSKGSGDIYFNIAKLDSIGTGGGYFGKMSGLFDANFSSFKITRGRFDHIIEPPQVHF